MGDQALQILQQALNQVINDGQNLAERRVNRILDSANKARASAPKFTTGENFRQFESEFRIWRSSVELDLMDGNQPHHGLVPADRQALILLGCFKGEPATRVQTMAAGSVSWNETILNAGQPDQNARFEDYLTRIRHLFLPPGESRMAKVEFKMEKQQPTQDMASYVSRKITLWELAYDNARLHHFSVLLDEVISGTGNMVIKRKLREENPQNPEELRDRAIALVATERQCIEDGSAESTSYDYLAAVSKPTLASNDNLMDGVGAFKDGCYNCGKTGHIAANCRVRLPGGRGRGNNRGRGRGATNSRGPTKPQNPPNDPRDKGKICTHCGYKNHTEAVCRRKAAGKPKTYDSNPNRGGRQRNRGNIRTIGDSDHETDESIQRPTDPFLAKTGEEDH